MVSVQDAIRDLIHRTPPSKKLTAMHHFGFWPSTPERGLRTEAHPFHGPLRESSNTVVADSVHGPRSCAGEGRRTVARATTKERPPFATGPKFREEPHDRLIHGCVVWRRSHTSNTHVRRPTGADRSLPVHLFSCRSFAQNVHRRIATDRPRSMNVTRDR